MANWSWQAAHIPSLLGTQPTALAEWKGLIGEGSDEDGIRVFVKHDECVGATNCCSGNKVRKLSFLLAEAIRSGATHVLTVVSSVTCGSFVMTWRRQEGYKVITAAQQHWHALDWEFPAACY